MLTENAHLHTLGLGSLQIVRGSVLAGNGALTSVDMASLKQVGMTLDLHRNNLTHLSLGPLRLVGADLLLQSNDALSLLDTGALTAIGGDLSVGFTALGLLDLGDVREIGGSLRASDNARVTTVDFGHVTSVGGFVALSNCAALHTLRVGNLTRIGKGLTAISTLLREVDLGGLAWVGGKVNLNFNAKLETVRCRGVVATCICAPDDAVLLDCPTRCDNSSGC